LGGGADLANRDPLPTSSDAPASQLSDIASLVHVGTPRFLALNMCATCGGIADTQIHGWKIGKPIFPVEVPKVVEFGVAFLSLKGTIFYTILSKTIKV